MTTANVLDTIQPALRDRMEIISLSGYTEEEKLEIARRHLIPKQIEENGLEKDDVKFDRKAIAKIISEYTQEAGLRQLEREIGKVCRKVARRKAELEDEFKPVRVTADNLKDFLAQPEDLQRRGPEKGRDRHRYRPCVDGGRRRHPVYRGAQDQGQGQAAC